MDKNDALYKAFLNELETLEHFRVTYAGERPTVPLGREDPDVQRLIESLAVFSARTRLTAERSVRRSALQLFRQHFPYLLNPLPATAMLQAISSSRHVDAVAIPKGSEVRVSVVPSSAPVAAATRTTDPSAAADTTLSFRTQRQLRILPMSLVGVDMFRQSNKQYRLVLTIEAAFFRNDSVGELNLYVNHLNDLQSSLAIFYQLKQHITHASVVFDQEVDEQTRGEPVRFYFGAPREVSSAAESFEHPLQQARAFFRFPQQALYLNVHIEKQPRNWESFSLCFDIDPAWPLQLRPNPDTFVLHTVPMINVRRDFADPIEHDGTRDRYPIRHPEADGGHVLHSVRGLYKITGTELAPLRPGIMGDEPDSYELEWTGAGDKRRGYAAFVMPSAFEQPVRVAVDAYWHQPGLYDEDSLVSAVRLAERHVDGLDFELSGGYVSAVDGPMQDSQPGLLHLLSIKNQRFLERDDVVFLLQAMGVLQERVFAELAYRLTATSVSSKPFAKKAQGFKYIYHLQFGTLDGSSLPVLDLFCTKLLDVLIAWSNEEVVELSVSVPNLEAQLHYS